MKEVFVVFIERGEYSDYTKEIDCAFSNEELAKQYCEEMTKKYFKDTYDDPCYGYNPIEVRDEL